MARSTAPRSLVDQAARGSTAWADGHTLVRVRLVAIVPVWNERDRLPALLDRLRREVDEVWVVDAGSPDGSADVARDAGARVVQSPSKGRGAQLRAGAAASAGDALVFVHADTRVPGGFGAAIAEALRPSEVVGGNFRLRFEPEGPTAALFALGYDLRRRFLGAYYGDSCIFVRRAVYDALGGIPDEPIFEDYAFARAMERTGRTAYVTTPSVGTSARRFEARPLRTLALYAFLQVSYELGVPPSLLSRLYGDVR